MPLAFDPRTLYEHPNALASEYSRFRVSERILLSGHSHQAWPDTGAYSVPNGVGGAAPRADRKGAVGFGAVGGEKLVGHDVVDALAGAGAQPADHHDDAGVGEGVANGGGGEVGEAGAAVAALRGAGSVGVGVAVRGGT